jgi:hypothetical protein
MISLHWQLSERKLPSNEVFLNVVSFMNVNRSSGGVFEGQDTNNAGKRNPHFSRFCSSRDEMSDLRAASKLKKNELNILATF